MMSNNKSRRLKLLGASSVVTIAATIGLAQAATIILPGTAATGQSGASTQLIINAQSLSNAALSASYTPGSVSNASPTTIGIETAESTIANGLQGTESLIVDGNNVLATATANTGISTIQVSQANRVLNGSDAGIAVGSSQSAQNFGANASVTQGRVGQGLTGGVLPPASELSLDQNAIAATATGNSSTNAVAGIVPTAAPGAPAFASVTVNPAGTTASAGVVVANDQRASLDRQVRSQVTDSLVGINASVDADTSSSITATGNSIDASSQANTTQNFVRFNPTTVVAPTQVGGASVVQTGAQTLSDVNVAVANVQTATGTGRIDSDVSGSNVVVNARPLADDAPSFDGEVTATGNRISVASGVNRSTLNGIRIDGLSVEGSEFDLVGGVVAGTVTSSFNRDLTVVNSQTASGRSPVSAVVSDSDVRVNVADTSGSVTAIDNDVSASSNGNEAIDNRIDFDGRSFAATAAVANNQTNAASQFSRVIGSDIAVTAGNVTDGTIAVRGNRLASTAAGNTTSNAIDVTAFSVEVPAGGVSSLGEGIVVASLVAAGQPVLSSGLGILSNQSNSSSVNANAVNSTIGARLGGISDGSASVGDNTVEILASGNDAVNSLALDTFSFGQAEGTALPLNINSAVLASLGILSVQSNGGSTNAIAFDNSIGLSSTNEASGSDLSVGGNTLRTAGVGNSNASLLFGGFDASGAAQEGQTFGFDGSVALRSDQTNSSFNQIGQQFRNSIGVDLAGGEGALDGSTIAVSGNALSAQGTGNSSSNRIFLNGFSLANSVAEGLPSGTGYVSIGEGGVIASVADLSAISRQTNGAFSLAQNVQGSIGLSASNSTVNGGSAAVSNNSIGAAGGGNIATNVVAVAGADGAPAQSVSAAIVAASSQDNGGFVGTSSLVDRARIGASILGADDANITAIGNSLEASSIGNSATNAVEVAAFEINGTRNQGLFNLPDVSGQFVGVTQASFAAVNRQSNTAAFTTASLNDSAITIAVTGGVANSDLSVSNNVARSVSLGNSATNSVQLTAGSTLTNPSASVLNGQTSSTSTVSTTSGVSIGLASLGGTGNAATVGGNTLTALAGGNSGSNTLSASSFGQSGTLVGGIAASDGTTRSPFAVTSVQLNSGAHEATVTNASIGIVGTGLTGGGSQRVGGNSIAAVGVANEAVNRIALNTGGRSAYGGAAINNVQTNLSGGNVTSTVTGARIGATSQFGSGLSSAVSGNTISASATGNSAVNSIGGSVGSFYGSSR